MKYIIILGDGMADTPVSELGDKTPLQCAHKPHMDRLAKRSEVGMVRTVPEGMPPGSDVANLSVMGYDPHKYYTGRSPLEAISMGINLDKSDVAFRCNLVTLSEEENYEEKIMIDYSSDEISTSEAELLIKEVQKHLNSEKFSFYPGISYRHCMVWHGGPKGLELVPPHDILEKNIGEYLPSGDAGDVLLEMMKKSYDFLKDHSINRERRRRGLRPANSIWLWGEGKKPSLTSFYQAYGLKGSVISAVDLVKGLGICAGLKAVEVQGATGNINTNFKGKAEAALRVLKDGQDFVYIHIEAPDECGHRHEIDNKVKSIELIDQLVLGTLLEGLDEYEDYKIMILPDHPTPLAIRTHTSDPVPYLIYHKKKEIESPAKSYDELEAAKTGLFIEKGHELMGYFIG